MHVHLDLSILFEFLFLNAIGYANMEKPNLVESIRIAFRGQNNRERYVICLRTAINVLLTTKIMQRTQWLGVVTSHIMVSRGVALG